MPRYVYFVLLPLFFVAGCQQFESTSTVSDKAYWSVPDNDVDLNDWIAPKELLSLPFSAEMHREQQNQRILRYTNAEDITLDITLQALPGGWENMPAKRATDGHFHHRSHYFVKRAKLQGAEQIDWHGETQTQLKRADVYSHSIQFSEQNAGQLWQNHILTTVKDDALISARLRTPDKTPLQHQDFLAAMDRFLSQQRGN